MRRVYGGGILCMILLGALGGCGNPTPAAQETKNEITLGWARVHEATAVPLPGGVPINGVRPPATARVVLVNFWASTCGPCRHEMPILDDLNDSGRVAVVGVTRDMFEKYALRLIHEKAIGFPSWMDSSGRYMEGLADYVPPSVLPSSVLLVDGRIVAAHIGGFESPEEVTSAIDRFAAL